MVFETARPYDHWIPPQPGQLKRRQDAGGRRLSLVLCEQSEGRYSQHESPTGGRVEGW